MQILFQIPDSEPSNQCSNVWIKHFCFRTNQSLEMLSLSPRNANIQFSKCQMKRILEILCMHTWHIDIILSWIDAAISRILQVLIDCAYVWQISSIVCTLPKKKCNIYSPLRLGEQTVFTTIGLKHQEAQQQIRS